MPDSAASNRVIAIDLARGIAMLGVALVNIHAFATGWSSHYGLDRVTGAADVVVEYVVAMLFSHRSYPVLGFLFGVGLAWQWQRLPEASRSPKQLRPRLWALLAIGVVHGLLLWPGEILNAYGILGLAMTRWFLQCDERRLKRGVFGLFAVSISFSLLDVLKTTIDPRSSWQADQSNRASFAMFDGWEAQQERAFEFLTLGVSQNTVLVVWAFVLLGMWAGRTGWLTRFLEAPMARSVWLRIGAGCFVVGSAIELVQSTRGGWNWLDPDMQGRAWMSVALDPAAVGGLWLWLTVAALWARRGDSTLRSLIIAAGRASLTQFIGQSVVFAVLFNKSLVGWHGELGRGTYSLIALTTYLLLCAFIRAWLASGHAHGPLEIVWRWLTKILTPQPTKQIVIEGPTS